MLHLFCSNLYPFSITLTEGKYTLPYCTLTDPGCYLFKRLNVTEMTIKIENTQHNEFEVQIVLVSTGRKRERRELLWSCVVF